jgi:hypothetical protein
MLAKQNVMMRAIQITKVRLLHLISWLFVVKSELT